MYTGISLLVGLYSSYIVAPDLFRSYANEYHVIKYLEHFFDAVEAYSPFHEFINDSVSIDDIAKSALGAKIFTEEELKEYDGSIAGKGPFLAIIGEVFDVSNKAETYGPEGGYSFFSGKDGSRAFVTGEFNDAGLIDDIEGLSHQDYLGLQEWLEFYHKDYTFVGKLSGRFYDSKGDETMYKKKVSAWITAAVEDKEMQGAEQKMFPPCNSEWSAEKGHRVWCTKKSGGVERNWPGRPRRLFYPGRRERCACVKDFGSASTNMEGGPSVVGEGDLANPHLKEYEGCDSKETNCMVSGPEDTKN